MKRNHMESIYDIISYVLETYSVRRKYFMYSKYIEALNKK